MRGILFIFNYFEELQLIKIVNINDFLWLFVYIYTYLYVYVC